MPETASFYFKEVSRHNKRAFVRNMSGHCQSDVKQTKGLYKALIFSL
jgi:hypothetical protein